MSNEKTSEESFFNNIKSSLIERFTTPLYVYVISAFCIDNWDKILFIMFGKGNIEYRTSIVQMQGINFWQPIVYGIIITIITVSYTHLIEGEAKHKAELERIKSESQYNTSELKEKLERLDIIVKNQEARNNELLEERKKLDDDLNNIFIFVDDLRETVLRVNNAYNRSMKEDDVVRKNMILSPIYEIIKESKFKDIEKYLEKVGVLENSLKRLRDSERKTFSMDELENNDYNAINAD